MVEQSSIRATQPPKGPLVPARRADGLIQPQEGPILLAPDLSARIHPVRAEKPKARTRDLADGPNLSEAQVLAPGAAGVAVRVAAEPALLIPRLCTQGDVMALTRNA